MNDYMKNFRNFSNSFFFLFVISTGESWYEVMFDVIRAGKDAMISYIFYIFFIVLV